MIVLNPQGLSAQLRKQLQQFPRELWGVEESLTSIRPILHNPSIPLWEFCELHKEKSIVQLLSSEYMCLGDTRSVKTIAQLQKPVSVTQKQKKK